MSFALTHIIGFAAVANELPAASCSYTDFDFNTGTASTYTFTAAAIGAADADRFVIVACQNRNSSLTDVTIGGIAATNFETIPAGSAAVSFWGAYVPTGTTADIVFTLAANAANASVAVYRCVGLNSITPLRAKVTTTEAAILYMDAPAGSIVLAASSSAVIAAQSATWAGVTEQYDANVDTGTIQYTTGGFVAVSVDTTDLAVQCDYSNNASSFLRTTAIVMH